ncbi:MAG: phage major capsid protein [Rhodococcus sp.]|uniref:phage major capsid protein n=1 Tax=Rhodococcus sp. TaxID=1831 RepID=UPI0016B70761|nr:phage major capsid protein [Rhodococcus sp. (in: high G+C Gram-positive bacteria)]NLV77780.1 phage major capsid protein [Rhodococcus sp. (in: high G+C Gram-positive bacteria)]
MALYTTSDTVAGILPDTIGALIVQPVTAMSVAMEVADVIPTKSTKYRVPVVTDDPSAAWVAEGGEIPATDAVLDEIEVIPSKVAGLSIISRELATDSTPEAQQIVGNGLARDIAKKVDAAFFGTNITDDGPPIVRDAARPLGLLDVTGYQSVDTSGTITNTDPFAEALSKAETVGATVTSFIAHPDTVLTLAKVKKADGSNEPLLGNDPTAPTKRTVLGVPLYSSPAVAAGDIWAIPRDRVQVVLRDNVTLDVDGSAYFTSDRIALRATMRVGFAFPHAAAIVRLHDVA